MMHQPFGQLHSALLPAGKSFDSVLRAICQADAAQHLRDALLQSRSAQSIQMSLVPQVLRRCELHIGARRLKHHTNLLAN